MEQLRIRPPPLVVSDVGVDLVAPNVGCPCLLETGRGRKEKKKNFLEFRKGRGREGIPVIKCSLSSSLSLSLLSPLSPSLSLSFSLLSLSPLSPSLSLLSLKSFFLHLLLLSQREISPDSLKAPIIKISPPPPAAAAVEPPQKKSIENLNLTVTKAV